MNTHKKKGERGKECKGESKWARERDAALCISIFAPGALILYMLQYALLFICRDIDVSHELAGCVCVCVWGVCVSVWRVTWDGCLLNESLNLHALSVVLGYSWPRGCLLCEGVAAPVWTHQISINLSVRLKCKLQSMCVCFHVPPKNTHTHWCCRALRCKSICWLGITFPFISHLHVWWQLNTCEVACRGSVCLRQRGVPPANGTTRSVKQEVNNWSVICLHKPTSQDPPN